jgi:hypothetical protein
MSVYMKDVSGGRDGMFHYLRQGSCNTDQVRWELIQLMDIVCCST